MRHLLAQRLCDGNTLRLCMRHLLVQNLFGGNTQCLGLRPSGRIRLVIPVVGFGAALQTHPAARERGKFLLLPPHGAKRRPVQKRLDNRIESRGKTQF